MRILKFSAENIKKLRVVEITPDGAIVQITGPNGSGKTSVLDAIFYALAGTKGIPSQPVREGAESARVQLDLGEIIVTRAFKGEKSTLTVEAANGAKFPSPQGMLDALIGALAFDPLQFARMEPRAQLEALRRVVTLDTDIDAIDLLNAARYSDRTEVNRKVKDLRSQMEAIKVPEGLPVQAVDISGLLQQMESAAQHNTDIATRAANRQAMQESVINQRKQAADLLAVADATEKKLAGASALPEPIDSADLRTKVEIGRTVNAGIDLRMRREKLAADLKAATLESDELTLDMEQDARKKAAAIARATMPVPGLSFGDGEVLYQGIPFAQASSSEQLRVSVGIAMANNPQLRVLRVKDGGLLDELSMTLLTQMAETNDFQIWVETAGTHRPGIVMEDGAVAYDSKKSDKDGVVK